LPGLIAHDWIEKIGGAESVLLSMIKTFPDSEVVTLWSDQKKILETLVQESNLRFLPRKARKQLALPLMSSFWQNFNTKQYDWILSSSHLFAHHIGSSAIGNGVKKYSYIHTPARYFWVPEIDGRLQVNSLTRAVSARFMALDKKMAQTSNSVVANSRYIASRIENCWQVEVDAVIYPPVDVYSFQALGQSGQLDVESNESWFASNGDFLLSAGRLVPYKRVDKAIEIAHHLRLPLVIVGDGPDKARLMTLAEDLSANVLFIGPVTQSTLGYLYRNAIAFLSLAEEDFGIMNVEAIASGARVIANRAGGAAESVSHGQTGFLCDPEDLFEIKELLSKATDIDPALAFSLVEKFDTKRFEEEVKKWITP